MTRPSRHRPTTRERGHPSAAGLALALAASVALSSARGAASERTGYARTPLPEKIVEQRQSWGLDLSVGTDYASGNVNQSLVKGSATAFKASDLYIGYLSGNVNTLSAGGVSVRDEWKGTARLDRKLSEAWKVFVFTTHSHNSFLLLEYRGSVGAGPWLDIKTPAVAHGISVALAPQYEIYSTGEVRHYLRSSLRYVLTVALDTHSTAGIDAYFAPALAGGDSLRATASPYVEADVWERTIGLKLEGSLEYDSSPLPGVQTMDRELTTSVTLHLGG